MRHATLSLLVALCLSAPLYAQEAAPPAAEPAAPTEQPTPAAATTEPPSTETAERRAAGERDQANAQLTRLRQENQRLRAQLQEEQAKLPPALLTDQQQWFAVGGGVGVLGFLAGVLVSRGRRRRQWLN